LRKLLLIHDYQDELISILIKDKENLKPDEINLSISTIILKIF